MAYEPPLLESYKAVVANNHGEREKDIALYTGESCELPLIDLGRLHLDQTEREECMKEIIKAAADWGFFQVVNHGIPREIVKNLHHEGKKIFHFPFVKKSAENVLNLSAKCYRWGNPMATAPKQLSWSEAFHIPVSDISRMNQHIRLRSIIEAFATKIAPLAETLATILGQNLGMDPKYFGENCLPITSYLRLNRYPPCPVASNVFGLLPHSDSSFLTIVYQDKVGGLQLMKGGEWIGVNPNPLALVVNVGDLFQALSNDAYRSIKHRVLVSEKIERFSAAYFYCPSYDTVIETCCRSKAMYKKFSFMEYKLQIAQDVNENGEKVGLSKFLYDADLDNKLTRSKH